MRGCYHKSCERPLRRVAVGARGVFPFTRLPEEHQAILPLEYSKLEDVPETQGKDGELDALTLSAMGFREIVGSRSESRSVTATATSWSSKRSRLRPLLSQASPLTHG